MLNIDVSKSRWDAWRIEAAVAMAPSMIFFFISHFWTYEFWMFGAIDLLPENDRCPNVIGRFISINLSRLRSSRWHCLRCWHMHARIRVVTGPFLFLFLSLSLAWQFIRTLLAPYPRNAWKFHARRGMICAKFSRVCRHSQSLANRFQVLFCSRSDALRQTWMGRWHTKIVSLPVVPQQYRLCQLLHLRPLYDFFGQKYHINVAYVRRPTV